MKSSLVSCVSGVLLILVLVAIAGCSGKAPGGLAKGAGAGVPDCMRQMPWLTGREGWLKK